MDDLTRLQRLAQDLVVRVRDDSPTANAQWLASVSEEDRWALLFVLAAAVPDDRPWSQLIRWTEPDSPQVIAERRRQLDIALNGAQPAGVSRPRPSVKPSHARRTVAA